MIRRTLVIALALALPGFASAQQFNEFTRTSPKIVHAFRPAVTTPSQSTVRIRAGGKDIALGAVVGADGWILTKASEIDGQDVTCKFKDGKELKAKVMGIQEPYDLALLKVDTKGLIPVESRDSKDAPVGHWVATVGTGTDPIGVGVISVASRAFKPGDQPPKNLGTNGGYLGVQLDEGEGGAKIVNVNKGTPADKAGLKVNDIVTHIAGKKVLDSESMINAVQRYQPGQEITLRVKRAMEEVEVKATLTKRPLALFGGNPQERMGSSLSNRRGGFPTILQHDTIIKPSDCGGPLVDLDGKTVGINIARAGRTESYAIPAEVVQQLLPELMSGKLAPKNEEK